MSAQAQGLDPRQFLEQVLRPSLGFGATLFGLPGFAGPTPEFLLLGTAIQESGLKWLRQLGEQGLAGAFGLFQDELGDHEDLRKWVAERPALRFDMPALRAVAAEALVMDLRYATLVARLHYWRVAEPLPGDQLGLEKYYKVYYNSLEGAATGPQIRASFNAAAAIMGRTGA